jgi:hypothetical protein
MATIITRETGTTAVNRTLTNTELDNNFINLNADIGTRILSSEKAAVNGVATLDATGKVPATQLPSYVDDVQEAANLAAFPATGETGKIYVALDTNKAYRWSGSVYVYITSGAVDSVAGRTGVVVLTKSDVGLASADNTADSSKNVLSATKWTTARTISITGDLTGSVSVDGTANVSIAGTLPATGVSAGSYGSATAIPVFTVDAKGRITAASTSAITVGNGALSLSISTGSTNTAVSVGTGTGFTANSSNAAAYTMTVGPALVNLATLMTTAGAGFIRRGATADSYTIDTNTYLTAEADTLATVTGRGASTSTAVTLSNAANHYSGHFYYDAHDAAGNHYPHFNDGGSASGTKINWRLYTGVNNTVTHTWTTSLATFATNIAASNFSGTHSGSSSGTNTGDNAGVTSVGGTAPVVSSGGTTPVISMAAATASVNGYLTAADWTTFNNKQPAGSYLTDAMRDRGGTTTATVDTATLSGFYNQANSGDSHSLLVFNPGGSTAIVQQRFHYTGSMEFRNKTDSANWNSWKTVLTSSNVGTYAVTSIAATSPIVTSAAAGAITLSHATSGATAGTYNNVTVNTFGHVTSGSNTAYLTAESDTLATVTTRGNSTTNSIIVASSTTGVAASTRLFTDASGIGGYYTTDTYPRFTLGRDIGISGGAGLGFGGGTGSTYALIGTNGTSGNTFMIKLSSAVGTLSTTPNLTMTAAAFNLNIGALQQNGNQVLHAGNYTSYSPTLTGGSASGTWGISITGNANSAANLSGGGGNYIVSSAPGLGYNTAIQVREPALAGAQGQAMTYAPRLAFHWSGVVASSIAMEASGRIAIFNNPGTAYEAFACGTLSATNFSGSSSGTNTGDNPGVTSVAGVTPIISSGGTTPSISHATSGATAGTYNNVTVNTFGHVTSGSNVGYITGYTETDTLATVTGRGATTSTNVSLNGGISSYMSDNGVLFQSYNASASNAAQFSITHALGAVTIANARGTITLNGNVTGSSGSTTGNAATATNSSQLNGLSKVQLWNNSGNGHSTYQTFAAIPDFGVWFMQGSAAADTPQTGSQYYVQTQGLGNDYAYSSYALMTAVARDHALKYTYYRAREGGTWGSWSKGAAGYADTAGSAGSATYATSASRLYSTDASYAYGSANPYYGYLTYTGSRWRFQVSPASPAAVEVAYADTAGNGGVTSIAATTPIVASSSTGAITLSHATSGATAGTYNNVTVNTFGHVTAGSNAGYLTAESDTLATVTARGNVANAGNLGLTAGDGNGFTFWGAGDSYKISMGVGSLYQYGPVSDYSIKMQMDAGSTGRGFTWGRVGVAPVAGLNSTSGNFQTAGTIAASNFSGTHSGSSSGTNTGDNPGVTSVAGVTPIVSSGGTTPSISHATSGVGAGTYNSVTVNTFGHVTAGSNVGYITGYTETDTLATVTARGASTTTAITLQRIFWNTEGGNSNNTFAANHYSIGQAAGTWTHPYPDLIIGHHTGIRIGAHYNYGGTRFYNNSPWGGDAGGGETELMSIGNGDDHVRIAQIGYAGNSFRAPIFYDSNDTNYYVDPNATSRIRKTNLVASGTGWDDGLNLYSSDEINRWNLLVDNGASDSLRFAYNNSEALNINTSRNVTAYVDMRAPIFYDNDDTGYYTNPASTSDTAQRMRGGTVYGPNVTWSAYLLVGGDGRQNYTNTAYASVCTTNGNLHLDSGTAAATHINWYDGTDLLVGAGDSGTLRFKVYGVDNYSYATGSMRSPLFYDSDNTAYYLDAASNSEFNRINTVRTNNFLYMDNNYGHSIVGAYSASRYQGVFAMGDSYKLPADGTTTGSLYGLAWSHPNAGGAAANLNTHGLLVLENGAFLAAVSGSIRARDDMRAPIFYDNNNSAFYLDPNATGTSLNIAGSITAGGNITASSDIRLKEDIQVITNAIYKVKQITGVTYTRKENNKRQTGVIAQDVLKVLPEAVEGSEDSMYSVAYGNMVGLLIEAIKDQQTIIDLQESRIARLETLVAQLIEG